MGHGALSFDLNAHGMLNGQPNSYYENLEYGELKNYAQIGLESIDDIYFKGMYLRLIRTLEFLKKQPEWDGKRILVIGESQGGGQALAAAGFDSSVSAVVAIVPAMCDWGGLLVGRKGSWPYPFATAYNQEKMLSVLPYFDVAHILKGSKAKLFIEIGLIDTTCPATALFAAINQAKGEKMVFTVPYRGHHMNQSAYKEIWEKEVSQPRSAFIEDYLK
jgi:cephalosporin-C deacetylase-like acetyl esterase